MTGRRMVFAVLGLGMAGSQAGHLLAYQIRFGAAAQQIQSSGVHAYFPVVAKTALGVGAAALLMALLLAGVARVLNGGHMRSANEPSYVSVLAFLFSIQLAAFVAQEVGEAIVGGSSVRSAPDLLLWGTLGQLPIAAIGALAFRWLSARVEAAVGLITEIIRSPVLMPLWGPVRIPAHVVSDRALLTSRLAWSDLAKRGPPTSLRISSY